MEIQTAIDKRPRLTDVNVMIVMIVMNEMQETLPSSAPCNLPLHSVTARGIVTRRGGEVCFRDHTEMKGGDKPCRVTTHYTTGTFDRSRANLTDTITRMLLICPPLIHPSPFTPPEPLN